MREESLFALLCLTCALLPLESGLLTPLPRILSLFPSYEVDSRYIPIFELKNQGAVVIVIQVLSHLSVLPNPVLSFPVSGFPQSTAYDPRLIWMEWTW